MEPRPDAAATRRRRLARFAVLAFVAVGFFLVRATAPTEVDVSFELPPSFSVGGASVPRERFTSVEITVFDDEQRVVSTARQTLPDGLESPLTPPVSLRVPRGRYVARVTLAAPDGARVTRGAAFEVADEPSLRVELR